MKPIATISGRNAVPLLLAVLLLHVAGAATAAPADAATSAAATFSGMAPELWDGVTDAAGVTSFKGIPFAAPPVGEKRWQPPADYQPVAGHHRADSFAPACIQNERTVNWYQDLIRSLGEDVNLFDHPTSGYSEDCLYLNVWTPAMSKDAGLPVMVWIHGGANKAGWPFEPDYRGDMLARQDVVVVSLPYRLGVFGFFSHPGLVAEQGGVAGNYALLDLIHGLQWIQTHIAEFGGDPERVTLFGESAGATNIGYLMSSPQAAGLFARAIHQSAGYEVRSKATLAELTKTGEKIQQALGAANLDALRAMPGEALLAGVESKLSALGYGPVAGGHALPRNPREVFASQDQLPVQLMIGTNANEWRMYIPEGQTLEDYAAEFGVASEVVEDALGKLDEFAKMDRLATAGYMLCPSLFLAARVSESAQPAYVYQLTRVREGEHWQSVGAYHGAEIPYVFDTHAQWLTTGKKDHKLTRQIQSYWTNFARTGDPNGRGVPTWRPYRADRPRVLDLGDRVRMKSAPDQALCRAIAAVSN